MIINPVSLNMSRHHLEALYSAASRDHARMKGDTPRKRVLLDALLHLQDALGIKEA
jgi:hypothetical protein